MELTVDPQETMEKDRRIRRFLHERSLAGLLLSGTRAFAWATCGRDNHVAKGAENGVGHALYTPDSKYLLCDNIEEPRLRDEERLEEQGFRFVATPWHSFRLVDEARKLVSSGSLGADTSLPGLVHLGNGDLAPLRYTLTAHEIERCRWLGRAVSAALEATARSVQPGMTEHEMGALLEHRLEDIGITPSVTLIAADERIRRFRHPIPTGKRVERYVMLVTGAARWGLSVSATRLIHFGPASADLARRHDAVCRVDTVFNTLTRPGTPVADLFAAAQAAYAENGFADEWTRHHQGGATGYAGRDYKAIPGSKEIVRPQQAFAWNPSIEGTKSEDTIIAADSGPEILTTPSADWPTRRFDTPQGALDRPLILER